MIDCIIPTKWVFMQCMSKCMSDLWLMYAHMHMHGNECICVSNCRWHNLDTCLYKKDFYMFLPSFWVGL